MPGSTAYLYLYKCCAYIMSVCVCGMFCMWVLYKYMHYFLNVVLCFSILFPYCFSPQWTKTALQVTINRNVNCSI